MKTMQHSSNNLESVLLGIGGGMVKFFFLQVNEPSFTVRFFEAGITALFCGIMGMVGKHFCLYLWAWVKSKIRK